MKEETQERTCVGCRKKAKKNALQRYVRDGDKIVYDAAQSMSGRGVYLCPACWKVYNNPEENREKIRIQKAISHNILKQR